MVVGVVLIVLIYIIKENNLKIQFTYKHKKIRNGVEGFLTLIPYKISTKKSAKK
jgi:hypothetical protein